MIANRPNTSSLKKYQDHVTIAVLLIGIVLLGIYILSGRAASTSASTEVENGSVAGPATKVIATNASSNAAVQFNAGSSSGTYYVIGSGDIGKGAPAAKPTGDQILNYSPAVDAIMTFGDDAYSDGAPSEFAKNYDPYWGYKSDPVKGPKMWGRTYPSPGNHDYHTSGASGYYAYFNATQTSITGNAVDGRPDLGYFAWNLGKKWRFYSLNSEANVSAANSWLDADMKAHPDRTCSVAYWHSPPFTTGNHSSSGTMQSTYFTTMYNNNGDIVLTGHNHSYERFVPLTPKGVRDDAKGVLSLVVGTGGDLPGYSVGSPSGNLVKSATNILGNIVLIAKDDGTFTMNFIKAGGPTNFSDTVSGTCH